MRATACPPTPELITRVPRPDARDTAFERRYLPYVAERHDHLTIYGIDLRDAPDRWPLEVAYLTLEAVADPAPGPGPGPGALPGEDPRARTARLPADEALEREPRVLLRGDAGSGKTTLAQWLAVTAAREGTRIPFLLPLRTLVRTGPLPAPAAFLSAVGCPLTPPDGWAERVLTAGRGLILVDGLDEIPESGRHATRDWLRGLLGAFPGNRWLLTTRPTAVRADWLAREGFLELSLAPMGRAEVTTFVHRWHEAAGAPEYGQRLLDSLRTQRDLSRLATNPLMCGLICALHRERRGYLPTGRKELYDAALTMLLTRRDRERGMGAVDGPELGEEEQLELLQRIAYALVLSGRHEMALETAEGIVDRALPALGPAPGRRDAASVLRTLLLRSGVLRRPAEGVLDFVHRTFQDYLAARYAVEEGHLGVLAGRADDTEWEDVIRMAVAHARPRERVLVLRELLGKDDPRLTLLALACLEHVAALDPVVRAEVEERAAGLIPPRTTEAARELAGAGPLVLELLPGPEGLSDEEALGVAVTASVLGGEEPDGALAVLRRFRDHPGLDVRRQLVGTWHRFPAGEYAAEVLDHLDRTHLVLECGSPAQLAALSGMRPWPQLHVPGPYRAEDIVDAVRRGRRGDRAEPLRQPAADGPGPPAASHLAEQADTAGVPERRQPGGAGGAAPHRTGPRAGQHPVGDPVPAVADRALPEPGADGRRSHRGAADRIAAGLPLSRRQQHGDDRAAGAGPLADAAHAQPRPADDGADGGRLAGGRRPARTHPPLSGRIDHPGDPGLHRPHARAAGCPGAGCPRPGGHRAPGGAGGPAAGPAHGVAGQPARTLLPAVRLPIALPGRRGDVEPALTGRPGPRRLGGWARQRGCPGTEVPGQPLCPAYPRRATRPCSGSARLRRPPARSAGRRAAPTSPHRGR
ncbi:NACHT domain-containing protein [Streptomyces leeuwenhoekii]